MKFYVATGLVNIELAKAVIAKLAERGHTPAYDWTKHGDVRGISNEILLEVSANELNGVTESELVVVLLPGGAGTHTELGIALATHYNKRIIIWSETGRELGIDKNTCVFYHNAAVETLCCGKDALMEYLEAL